MEEDDEDQANLGQDTLEILAKEKNKREKIVKNSIFYDIFRKLQKSRKKLITTLLKLKTSCFKNLTPLKCAELQKRLMNRQQSKRFMIETMLNLKKWTNRKNV